MNWTEIAALVAAGFGGFLGLYAMINPGWASRLVRLAPMEGKVEGRSEFRATYGGLFFFSHAFLVWAIFSHQPGADLASGVLGAAWLGTGIGRLVSIAMDRAATNLNWINTTVENVLGLILFLPLLAPWLGL